MEPAVAKEIDISSMRAKELVDPALAIECWKTFAIQNGFKLRSATGMKHDKYIYMFCSRYGAPKVRANLKRLRESKKCSKNACLNYTNIFNSLRFPYFFDVEG
jgi:hypothetical protein